MYLLWQMAAEAVGLTNKHWVYFAIVHVEKWPVASSLAEAASSPDGAAGFCDATPGNAADCGGVVADAGWICSSNQDCWSRTPV